MLKVGSDFSGVGAFDQALIRLGVDYETVFACDMDKFARQTYIHNYREPKYYPENVYNRDIPKESLDIYMTSPPCQSFSLAGKRKGESDDRGILFYNSHEFIKINKPRYFIFENVKGLLSDTGGKTFGRWVEYLGGKSVNGTANMFPSENSVPYHIYYRVLNAKNYNIPQNRERVFIIGIRDDEDNNFSWPKEEALESRLKDVLESDVDEKYYLSDKMVEGLTGIDTNGISRTIRCGGGSSTDDKHNWDLIKVGFINQDTQASQVYHPDGLGQTLCAGTHGYANGYVSVKSATKKGYELAEIGEDSINFEHPESKTRRGRVGVGVSQTLTTSCNQGVAMVNVVANLPGKHEQNSRVYGTNGLAPTITTMQGGGQEPKIAIDEVVQLNQSKESGGKQPYQQNRVYADYGIMTTVDTGCGRPSVYTNYKIRKLTPRECFRLMDFPDTFSWPVSDSQAYKQAGNSICVGVLERILKNILHLQ